MVTMLIRLNTYNLDAAERAVILEALRRVESIVDAGRALGEQQMRHLFDGLLAEVKNVDAELAARHKEKMLEMFAR